MSQSRIFQVALSLIPDIGPVLARRLVAYTGSAEAVFKEPKSRLEKIPGLGKLTLKALNPTEQLKLAEDELNYAVKNNINFSFYLEDEFPERLKECEDAPVILYYKGKNCFNASRVISIVGTRHSTQYGEEACRRLIEELARIFPELVVVSGFAYGVDICAHKAALEYGLYTAAVFGHGIDEVYPGVHRKYVSKMLENGALVSEFPAKNKPVRGNFVSRNRIIAGLSDATIVIESGLKGGSLITAEMALSYNRDVFAFPGRVGDEYSKGCNNLIKKNSAALIESASDLMYYMKWDTSLQPKAVQQSLFISLSHEEEKLVNALKDNQSVSIDHLSRELQQPVSKLSGILLKLEFEGLVLSLPGKNYKLKR